ncbi:MAG: hypothetical protein MSS83_05485 [Methanobrevibacter sp.]|uniref:hypothetical protein n=1 Tax=Methanobrevibacter sp. TaxID=66852 RepID=UPI0031F5AA62|nr:hypothetical protein [Methanobrevibacter sp.]
MKKSLCWSCKNCYSGCSWSKNFEPVEGWDATPQTFDRYDSFLVRSCPLYENDGFIKVYIKDLIKMLDISPRTFFRLKRSQIKTKILEQGYKLFCFRSNKKWEYYLKRVN